MLPCFICKYCSKIIDKNKTQHHYFLHGLGAPHFEKFHTEERKPFTVCLKD